MDCCHCRRRCYKLQAGGIVEFCCPGVFSLSFYYFAYKKMKKIFSFQCFFWINELFATLFLFLLLLLIGNFFIYKKRQDVISAVKLVQEIDCSVIIFLSLPFETVRSEISSFSDNNLTCFLVLIPVGTDLTNFSKRVNTFTSAVLYLYSM